MCKAHKYRDDDDDAPDDDDDDDAHDDDDDDDDDDCNAQVCMWRPVAAPVGGQQRRDGVASTVCLRRSSMQLGTGPHSRAWKPIRTGLTRAWPSSSASHAGPCCRPADGASPAITTGAHRDAQHAHRDPALCLHSGRVHGDCNCNRLLWGLCSAVGVRTLAAVPACIYSHTGRLSTPVAAKSACIPYSFLPPNAPLSVAD